MAEILIFLRKIIMLGVKRAICLDVILSHTVVEVLRANRKIANSNVDDKNSIPTLHRRFSLLTTAPKSFKKVRHQIPEFLEFDIQTPEIIRLFDLIKTELELKNIVKDDNITSLGPFDKDKIIQATMRMKSIKNTKLLTFQGLFKGLGLLDVIQGAKIYVSENPHLIIRSDNPNFSKFVQCSRELWHLLPSDYFKEWVTEFWRLEFEEIKEVMKKDPSSLMRLDSRYVN
eukprot:NODE_142_length_15935_cov_1.439126.p8 type:complete len:229 gc:universal NODE_142_length_15935_cov_1.439126:9041-9727(+)